MGVRSRYIDYDVIADLYKQGRALPDDVLDRWSEAVRPHLPPRPERALRVADIGAGTCFGVASRLLEPF